MIVDYGSFDLALSIRRYDPLFQNLHGYAFGERNGVGQNETGYYVGFRGKVFPTTRLSFYFDQFKLSYPTSTNPMPVQGWDSVGLLEQKLARKLSLQLKIRVKNKEQAFTVADEYGREEDKLVCQRRINARLQMNCTMIRRLILRSRIEKVWVQWDDLGGRINSWPSSQGVMMYQDIRFDFTQKGSISYRSTFFDTETYDARLYQYEAGMPGMMTSRMLSGRGIHWYVLARYQIMPWLNANIKYSCSNYDDRDTIGSGWEEIAGDADHRMDFQLDWEIK